ncbi:aminodeoxychorismate/anthranilate synthase component II [Niabella pedocola]|uniref:Aminodeoxychorismate/anthranilate synthase component II n=1 Tax=Niabella pedocola TaxID=1752077 RepID=A0ABS8PYA0_9BACT|nr:aminodeoxychorismate/anthranilate synthase component II [Niabella pedocola]MCD2426060.1 aminodeoxychorismate/anthranilate synthase component II [Niabella pedocola]
MKLLVFDNYDSFTYNLVHMVEKILHQKVDVFRNDQIPLEEVKQYDKIILSPGPGIPVESGLLLPLIKEYAPSKSILGVCLGQQAIGETFGGTLYNLPQVYHGVATGCTIIKRSGNLFHNMPDRFEIGRYHSWVVSRDNFPEELEITAVDDQDMIMALRHKTYDVQGVQFHPESVLTPMGETIIRNWLEQ